MGIDVGFVAKWLSYCGHVCVSGFTVLAGVGAAAVIRKYRSTIRFELHRLRKIYSAYWCWLLLLILFSLCRGFSLPHTIFPEAPWLHTFANFAGILPYYTGNCIPPSCTIGTDWFISMIILCYLSVLLIRPLIEKHTISTLIFLLALLIVFSASTTPILRYTAYLFPFYAGYVLYDKKILPLLPDRLFTPAFSTLCSLIALLLLTFKPACCKLGIYAIGSHLFIVTDTIAALLLLICAATLQHTTAGRSLQVLGKYSMGIYLIHAYFITQFPTLTYWSGYSIPDFITLMLLCFAISLAVSQGFHRISKCFRLK
ncbi:MAG: acyltransferase [Akkermansia sp.]